MAVGVLLPLTGKNAVYGSKTLLGIQLALGIFGNHKLNLPVRLAIMDTQSNPEVARLAVEKLVSEDKVISIIGPLGGDEAETVAKQCTLSGIPNIALSQKEDLDGLGKYVFRMSVTNRDQIKQLVHYAMNDKGFKRFGMLYPNDNYGQELSRYFWEEVLKEGGQITALEYYEPGQFDFRNEVKKLLGLYYIGARSTELKELQEAKDKEKELMSTENKKKKDEEITLPPVKSFDAIFIPDDAKIAAQIAPYLPYYDAKGVVLLGTNTWNSYQLAARGGEHVEGAIFVDGFYSDLNASETKNFYKDFKEAYNSTPGILEAQGYDAGKLIFRVVDSITNGGKAKDDVDRETFKQHIYSVGPFVGTTGKISFDEAGKIQKKLFILGIEKGKIILKK